MADLPITVRGGVPTSTTQATTQISGTSHTATTAGDYLLVVVDAPWVNPANLSINSSTGVASWTEVGRSQGYPFGIIGWLGRVTTSGARTVTVSQNDYGETMNLHVYTLDAQGGDITPDGLSTMGGTSNGPYTQGSLTVAGSQDLLVAAHGILASSVSYGAAPTGMTGATTLGDASSGHDLGLQTAFQQLTSGGSTGTRTHPLTVGGIVGHRGWMLALRNEGSGVSPPEVGAGTDVELTVGDTLTRTATETGSEITSRSWTVVSGPAQVGATLATTPALTWTPTVHGTYVLRYTATNAAGSDSDTVTITVVSDQAAVVQEWGTPLPSSDEFDTPGIPDPTKWAVYGAGGTYGGDECWEGHEGNGRRCVDQVAVTPDGYLRITGTPDGDTGALSHVLDQQYGRWEVRARAVAETGATGNPYHAVLIVWPRSNEWPIHGEYDFLEVDVGDQSANAWLHYPHPPLPGGDIEQEQATQAGVNVAEFHNYALEWTPTSLVGYLDGIEWFRFSDGEGPNGRGPIQGMPAGHLTIQLDDFFPEAGLQQAYLDVEWARVYSAPIPGPGVYVGEDVDDHRVKTVLTRTASELGTGVTARSWTILSGPSSAGSVIGSTSTLTWTPTIPGEYRIEYRATNAAGSSADQLKVIVPPPPVHAAETTIDGGLLVEAAVSVHARAAHASPGGALAVASAADATYRVGTELGGVLDVAAGPGTVEQVRADAGGALTVDADATPGRAATVTVAGVLDVAARVSLGQQVTATAGGLLGVYAVPGEAGEATLGGTLTVDADAWQARAIRASIDARLDVAAHATADYRTLGVTLGGQLAVDADGRRAHPATAGIDGVLDVVADATRVKLGRASIDGRLTLSSDATRVVHPTIDVGGSLGVYAVTEVARGGALNLSVWAVDRQAGGRLVPLPHFVKADVSDIANDAGALTLDYPATGAGFDLLRRDVAHDSDLEVEVWLGGRRETAMRGYLDACSGDDVAEGGVWSFTGSLMPIRLAQTVIEPQTGDPKHEFRAAAATPGAMALLLFAQAQDRGALTDLTVDFTADRDSTGRPWPEVFTGKWSPGTTYLQWIQTLVALGLCETEVTADKVWRLHTFGHRGQDLSTGLFPVTLRRGRNLGEAGRRATVRDAGTDFFVAGAEGIYTRVGNVDARTRRGRAVEAYSSVGNLDDPDAVTAAAQRTAAANSTGPDERSFALALGTGHPRPGQSFAVGDKVRVDTDGQLGVERVAQWSLTATASGISGSAITGDLIRSRAAALLARITAAESGSIIAGTSDTGEDVGTPLPPEGVVAGSTAFVDHLDVYSSVTVGWLPVEHNTDGTACTDLDGYRCEYALASSPEEWQFGFDVGNGRTSASFTTLPGRIVYVRVLAYDRNGNRSAWSDVAEHVTEDDTTPPPNASAPACTNYLGTFKITWNGRSEAGTEMHAAAPDFTYVEVHLSTGSMFLPDDSTLVGRMYGPGDYVVTDLTYGVTYYARLVAVDIRGNRADPSQQGSATPGKVVNVDLGEDAVDRAQIRSAAIGNAQIDNLAVNDAKIGNVSMGKVTAGQIKAAMVFTEGGLIGTRGAAGTGPGWDGDSAGIRFYNSAGVNTINFNGFTGGALVTGEYRTAMTGERFVINPGGANPDEIRFYPSSSNQYGYMQVVTSYSDVYGYQPGVQFKAHSGRGDGYAGQLAVFPDYASLSWGATYVQTTPLLVGFAAPRFHFGINTNLGVGDNTWRLGLTDSDGFDDTTVIEYHLNVPGEPGWRSVWFNSGIRFGSNHVGAVNAASNGYVPMRASAFPVSSLRSTKQDIADLDYDGGALGALRRAPVQKWRRITEVNDLGDDAMVHIGPMVDDLPPELAIGDFEEGDVSYAIDSLIGLVHGGVNQLAELVSELTSRVERIERA